MQSINDCHLPKKAVKSYQNVVRGAYYGQVLPFTFHASRCTEHVGHGRSAGATDILRQPNFRIRDLIVTGRAA